MKLRRTRKKTISIVAPNNSYEPKPMSQIRRLFTLTNIHTNEIYCIIELSDKRIATASSDRAIRISSLNPFTKEWNQELHKENAHDDYIFSLCEFNLSKLISCSSDKTIKIWTLSKTELSLITTLQAHTDIVWKISVLNNTQFASCSKDQTVKIWEDINTFQELLTIKENDWVWSILCLKSKDILVTSCGDTSSSISFWNTVTVIKEYSFPGYFNFCLSQLIELSNGNIALASWTEDKPIVIIDPNTYTVIKEIKLNQFVTAVSAMCVLNDDSFVFMNNGTFLQISNKDYSIMYKKERLEGLFNACDILLICNGRYMVISNNYNGVSIVQPCFKRKKAK